MLPLSHVSPRSILPLPQGLRLVTEEEEECGQAEQSRQTGVPAEEEPDISWPLVQKSSPVSPLRVGAE